MTEKDRFHAILALSLAMQGLDERVATGLHTDVIAIVMSDEYCRAHDEMVRVQSLLNLYPRARNVDKYWAGVFEALLVTQYGKAKKILEIFREILAECDDLARLYPIMAIGMMKAVSYQGTHSAKLNPDFDKVCPDLLGQLLVDFANIPSTVTVDHPSEWTINAFNGALEQYINIQSVDERWRRGNELAEALSKVEVCNSVASQLIDETLAKLEHRLPRSRRARMIATTLKEQAAAMGVVQQN